MITSRQILLQVTLPAVLIGFLVCGSCIIGVWSINQLQVNRNLILTKNVRSLQAAQEMQIRLRQLRFHSFLCLLDPTPARRAVVEEDQALFEAAWQKARSLAALPGEEKLLEAIASGYARYEEELDNVIKTSVLSSSRADVLRWADHHPVRHLMIPCEELLRLNQHGMDDIVRQSEAVGEQGRGGLILLGLLGAGGGLISGFGVAWGLSRSMTRLRIRLQDASAHLDQEISSVRVIGEGNQVQLDRLVEHVGDQIRKMVARSQQQLQEMLRAEQLAAVGQLAANVAHEVRNPLTGIKLLVGAALKAQPPQPLSHEDLQVIHDEIKRLEAKVQALLDFARPSEGVPVSCDLRDLVHASVELVRPRLQQTQVQTQLDLPEQPVRMRLERDQFMSLLVNLFLNALDAMPQGGQLQVAVRPLPSGEIRLTVADTGCGIAPSMADRLFTPFASTKENGTGLGLSICRRVVQDHGGTLQGENRPEGGACFTITLPPAS